VLGSPRANVSDLCGLALVLEEIGLKPAFSCSNLTALSYANTLDVFVNLSSVGVSEECRWASTHTCSTHQMKCSRAKSGLVIICDDSSPYHCIRRLHHFDDIPGPLSLHLPPFQHPLLFSFVMWLPADVSTAGFSAWHVINNGSYRKETGGLYQEPIPVLQLTR